MLLINSQQWLHFRNVTKQRGIPAGFPGMWGLWVWVWVWGGRGLAQTMSLPSEYNVFHTATPTVSFLNLLMCYYLNNDWISHLNCSSIAEGFDQAQIIGIPRGRQSYPMVGFSSSQVGGFGSAVKSVIHHVCTADFLLKPRFLWRPEYQGHSQRWNPCRVERKHLCYLLFCDSATQASLLQNPNYFNTLCLSSTYLISLFVLHFPSFQPAWSNKVSHFCILAVGSGLVFYIS